MVSKYVAEFDAEECRGIVRDPVFINDLDKRWFGRRVGDLLYLEIVEIAYLLLKSKITIKDSSMEINDLESFMNTYYECLKEFFWPRLVVYRDLRDRGRRVRVLGGNEFLVRDKYGELRLVVVLEEGRRVGVSSIPLIVDKALDNGLKPVLAIVSLQGDLTYYELTIIQPSKES